jgi:hypothetical protein
MAFEAPEKGRMKWINRPSEKGIDGRRVGQSLPEG